jgi:hypothetical protein
VNVTYEKGIAMRNLLLATVTGFALSLAAAPSFAADPAPATKTDQTAQGKADPSNNRDCVKVLADKTAFPESDVKACEAQKQ